MKHSFLDSTRIFFYKLYSYRYWEFWSAKIFYIPIVFYYIFFMFRYLISPKAIAYLNPCFEFGGMSFDSKYSMLKKFFHYPEFTTKTILIDSNSRSLEQIEKILEKEKLKYPIIAKPDKAHRGNGFRIIRSKFALEKYLIDCKRNFLIQEYIEFEKEYGVFWIRIPNQKGKITSITRKVLPRIFGDGKKTLKELIFKDSRAKFLASIYFEKNQDKLNWILSKGDSILISNAGNHCQGAIFEDGFSDIRGKSLEKLYEICNSIEGFDFGRMDIKFKNEESLYNGKDFKILEVNGSEAESTHIYDRKYSLLNAYITLFEQWDLLFKIAKINKQNGFKPAGTFELFVEYINFFIHENVQIKGD